MFEGMQLTRSLCVDQLTNLFVSEADCARGIVGLAVAIVLQHEFCHEVRLANSLNLSI